MKSVTESQSIDALFDLTIVQKCSPSTKEEPPDLEELEELEDFAKLFKQKRIKLGYTHGDISVALGNLYGNNFSQTTVSRFEALSLSFENMSKLKPILQKWLEDTDANTGQPYLSLIRFRQPRTSIENTVKVSLEMAFQSNP